MTKMERKGKQKDNKRGREAKPNVSEVTRIQITQYLEEFRKGDAQEYTFEADLSNFERASVHEMCRKMGMVSKSSGRGDKRRVTVYKNKNKRGQLDKVTGDVPCLMFSEETKAVLEDLFTRYPPQDCGELSEENLNPKPGNPKKQKPKHDNSFLKPCMSTSDISKKMESLASGIKEGSHLQKIAKDRAKLPISSFKNVITSMSESHQVVLISGETGCGKTTQVPQFLLDDIWSKGRPCKIVCTQPRRLSAISVAERISYERGENIGDTVGYKIRLESKGGKHSSILFCTNGVLLRMLIGNCNAVSKTNGDNKTWSVISEITHIIVDEIHERDHFADFMLAILRDLLPFCPDLRLILMSATIDSERFSQYFGGCPIVRVPGFTYPVKTFYLEDVLSILKSMGNNHLNTVPFYTSEKDNQLTPEYKVAMDESINLALSSDEFEPLLELVSSEPTPKFYNYQHSSTGVSPLMVFAGKGRVSDVCMLLSFGADSSLQAKDESTALDWAQRENQEEIVDIIKKHNGSELLKFEEQQDLLDKYLSCVNPEVIDTVLIERLLQKICTDSYEGAILVFLPGWEDINQTKEKLISSSFFRDTSKFFIVSLHSMIPSVEQKKVFRHPPPGVRKIILSTNIAETAVTIDDVVYVIDSGRIKEKSYDPYNNVSTLQSSWVSKASAKQREGRSGRCQPGICYHLYSKTRAASLLEFQVPEIKRMPIEELCLQVKLLDPHCKISDFLQKTLDPPVPESIRNAIMVLQNIGALTPDEHVTELGQKLGSLPVHPSISKMLFFAILMNCLDPALTLACASDYRDPFVIPMAPEEKKRASAAKAELSSLYGGQSDQLTVIAAFECWQRAKAKGQEAQFCSRYFVSSGTMNMLSGMRKQLQKELVKHGLIPECTSNCSLNASDPGILRAIIVAGMYPMIGKLLPPRRDGQRCVVETASESKVRLHPHSLNFKLSFSKSFTQPLIIYDEITRGDGGLYIKNCTVAGPYPILLLATEMVVAPPHPKDYETDEDSDRRDNEEDEVEMSSSINMQGEKIMSSPDNKVSVIVDRWLFFESTALDVAQIYFLRERLSSAILFKVKHPLMALPPVLGASVHAVACILSYDGLSGIPTFLDSVDSLASRVNATAIDKSNPQKHTGRADRFLRTLMDNNTPSKSASQVHKSISNRSVSISNQNSASGVQARNSKAAVSSRNSFKRRRGNITHGL